MPKITNKNTISSDYVCINKMELVGLIKVKQLDICVTM